MCLGRVERTRGLPPCRGYKIFDSTKRRLLVGQYIGTKVRPVGQWLDEREFRISPPCKMLLADDRKPYKTGWHVYAHLKDAREARYGSGVIYRVSCRNVVARGVQGGKTVLVCQKVKIGKRVSSKPRRRKP